jgi:hypothetical protein
MGSPHASWITFAVNSTSFLAGVIPATREASITGRSAHFGQIFSAIPLPLLNNANTLTPTFRPLFHAVSLTNPHSSLKIVSASLIALVPEWRNWQTR